MVQMQRPLPLPAKPMFVQRRFFSLKMDQDGDRQPEKDRYSSQFDNLLNKNQKISQEEQDFIDRQKEARRIADEEEMKAKDEAREKDAQRKAQDFEDMIKGKPK